MSRRCAPRRTRIRSSRLDRARARWPTVAIARNYDLACGTTSSPRRRDGATVGGPHIADALVARGLVADRTEAFADILSPRNDYYVALYAPHPMTAVDLIAGAGGCPSSRIRPDGPGCFRCR